MCDLCRSSLLIESATYSGSLSQLEPMGVHLVSLELDQHGIVPAHLDSVLSSWSGEVISLGLVWPTHACRPDAKASCALHHSHGCEPDRRHTAARATKGDLRPRPEAQSAHPRGRPLPLPAGLWGLLCCGQPLHVASNNVWIHSKPVRDAFSLPRSACRATTAWMSMVGVSSVLGSSHDYQDASFDSTRSPRSSPLACVWALRRAPRRSSTTSTCTSGYGCCIVGTDLSDASRPAPATRPMSHRCSPSSCWSSGVRQGSRRILPRWHVSPPLCT